MILWYFFIKNLFTYEHMLNGKSKKYLIWNLIDTKNISRCKLYHKKKNNPIFSAYFFNKLAPQPHQGILRVQLYAVGQGDVLGEEENLWHEEVVGVPFRHFLHALPRHGEKYLGASVLRLMMLWTHFLSASMRASRCSTATSCGIFFSMQTCLRYRLTLLGPAPT